MTHATDTRTPTRGKKANKNYCTCPICFPAQTPNGVYFCRDDREHAAYDNGVYITAGTLIEAEEALNKHRDQSLTHTARFEAADAARRVPTPTPMPTPDEIDEVELCGCGKPADDHCWSCRIDLCEGCNDRFHRHERVLPIRRNGTAFFDGQRAVAAFRKSTIESHLDRARRHAAEIHGDLGDAGYSEHVQAEADALFN